MQFQNKDKQQSQMHQRVFPQIDTPRHIVPDMPILNSKTELPKGQTSCNYVSQSSQGTLIFLLLLAYSLDHCFVKGVLWCAHILLAL